MYAVDAIPISPMNISILAVLLFPRYKLYSPQMQNANAVMYLRVMYELLIFVFLGINKFGDLLHILRVEDQKITSQDNEGKDAKTKGKDFSSVKKVPNDEGYKIPYNETNDRFFHSPD